MARGGFGQRRKPRSSGTFLDPRAGGQAKPHAFRRDPDTRQHCQNVIGLGPAFRPQPVIRDKGKQPPIPRRHPIPRKQGSRKAMRPTGNRHGKAGRRAKWPKRRHGGSEFGATDRRGQRRKGLIPMPGLPALCAATAIGRALRLRARQVREVGA